MDTIFLFLLMFGMGAFSLYLGLSGYLGYRRKSYILWYAYGYVAGGINYSLIPLGICFIIWAFVLTIPLPESLAWFIFYISFGIGLTGILFGVFQPRFLLPDWYRWLEENHSDIMPYLQRDLEHRDYKTWQRQTNTQEGLEAWVAEVRVKNNLQTSPP